MLNQGHSKKKERERERETERERERERERGRQTDRQTQREGHKKIEPVAKRHHEVSVSLALLLSCCEVSEGSRAATLTEDNSCRIGRNSVCPSVCMSVCMYVSVCMSEYEKNSNDIVKRNLKK